MPDQIILHHFQFNSTQFSSVQLTPVPSNQPINQSVNQPISQWINQSTNQPINQSINQSISHHANHINLIHDLLQSIIVNQSLVQFSLHSFLPFVHVLARSFVRSFAPSLARSLVRSFVHSSFVQKKCSGESKEPSMALNVDSSGPFISRSVYGLDFRRRGMAGYCTGRISSGWKRLTIITHRQQLSWFFPDRSPPSIWPSKVHYAKVLPLGASPWWFSWQIQILVVCLQQNENHIYAACKVGLSPRRFTFWSSS